MHRGKPGRNGAFSVMWRMRWVRRRLRNDSVEAIAEAAGINNRQLRVEMEHTPVCGTKSRRCDVCNFRGHRIDERVAGYASFAC